MESLKYNFVKKLIFLLEEDFDQRWKECSIRGWENKDAPDEDIQTNPLYCKLC
jgi:hypothetical protein